MRILNISPARQNLISRIVYPKREVRIPEMSNIELYDKLLGAQDYLNAAATRHRLRFSFTEVPIYKGCMVACSKDKEIMCSDYITVDDNPAEIERKIAETVYKLVPEK